MNDNIQYDDNGLNTVDPSDSLGIKTSYITLVQKESLKRYLPHDKDTAIDIGCGYGRMSCTLKEIGYNKVIGIDPSEKLINYAKQNNSTCQFLTGSLPHLPIETQKGQTIFLINILRVLHLMNKIDLIHGIGQFIHEGDRLVIIDNLRKNHPDYLEEKFIIELMQSEGLRLEARHAIRGVRWPWVPLLRYGLIPKTLHPALVKLELALMKNIKTPFRWQYMNVLWIFRK